MRDHTVEILIQWIAEDLVMLLLGLVAALVVTWLLKSVAMRYIKEAGSKYKARKLIHLLGYLLFAVVLLFIYSENLGEITVALGLAGAGITFALQEVIVSFAGWLLILFSGTFKTGDRIKIAGIRGDVVDVGVLKTTLMEMGEWIDGDLYNGRIVSVSNNVVFKEAVHNYSADFPFLWDEIRLNFMHGSDEELIRKIFLEVGQEVTGDYVTGARKAWDTMLDKYLIEPAMIDPMVSLSADENSLSFTVRYIVDSRQRRSTRDQISTLILKRIRAHADQIRLATQTLQLVNPDRFHVEVEQAGK